MDREQTDREQAEQRQMEQEQEWWRDHSKTREQPAGQERTKVGDTRALEHHHPVAAPPSAEDRTPTARRGTLQGEPPEGLRGGNLRV